MRGWTPDITVENLEGFFSPIVFFFLKRVREAPLTVPPDFIELMKATRQQGLSQQGYKVRGASATSVPRKIERL